MPRELLNLFDYEERAKDVMPRAVWDRIHGGAFDQVTELRARPAFESILLRPKMLRGVGNRDTSTTILGQKVNLPVMPASPGHHQYGHSDGELNTARGAHAAGTIMTLSHFSNYSMEEVAKECDKRWFQLYVFPDREFTRHSIQRAEDAGYQAIMVTVDVPVRGPRGKEIDAKNRYHHPKMVQGNLNWVDTDGNPTQMGSGFDPSITWDIVDWIRSITKLPVVVKGILAAEDGRIAAECGVDGVVVSNHGARIVDGMLTSIEALPEVVEAANGRYEVYLDGHVRRGIDVLKALALGARACLIGKPLFFGMAVSGAEGVADTFEILRKELDFAMAMCGIQQIDDIGPDLVMRPALTPF